MSKRLIITLITLLVIAISASIAIFLAKGYSFSPSEKRIVGSGIVTIKSEPDAASVFIDGHLTTATNATISSLTPKTYTIKVVKEGYIPWEKQITVKEGLVNDIKVTLFPSIPSIYPLTFTGVKNPVLSPDGAKLAYIIPPTAGKKAGVWVWTMANNQPIAFVRSSEPHQIATSALADFSESVLKWSPDSKQVLVTVGANNYLMDADSLNTDPRDITAILSNTLNSWEEDKKAKAEASVLTIRDLSLKKIASESASVKWSPDETKFMVEDSVATASAKLHKAKVYDLEENKSFDLPEGLSYYWLPDSRHIILIEKGTISLVEFDGTNKAIIYAGNFLGDFVFPWPDSSRISIVSSFPTPTASEPNLYGINLR
jgi:hypothetical protein